MSLLYSFCALLLPFFSLLTTATAFTYTFGTPSQCDSLPLTWTGGTAPFSLSIVPVFGTPRNITIPDSAFSNGKGSYSFQLPIAKDKQFVLVMSDATGFNAGGTTQVLTAKASTSGAQCATADPTVAFSFQLNTALQQCRPFTFSAFGSATAPLTIAALIPGGAATVLYPTPGSNSLDWTASVAQGTSMIFMMTDGQGRSGGSSDVRLVAASDDATCLNANSPATTTNPPSVSSTKAPTSVASTPTASNTSSPSPSASAPPSQGFTIAAIAGTVIGSLLFLAVSITLGLFFLRKKRESGHGQLPPDGPPPGGHGRRFGSGALELNNASPYGAYGGYDQTGGGGYALPHGGSTNAFAASNPFLDNPSQATLPYGSQYDVNSTYGGRNYEPSEAGSYQPPEQQRFGNMHHSSPSLYPPSNYASNPTTPADPFNASSAPMLPEMHHSPPQLYPPPQLPSMAAASGASAGNDPFRPHSTAASGSSGDRDNLPYLQSSGSTTAGSTTMSSAAQRKAAMAGVNAYKPSRFILHTDVEDDLPPVDEDEIIELPPQYSERRGPPPTTTGPPPPLTTVTTVAQQQQQQQQHRQQESSLSYSYQNPSSSDPFRRAP